MKVEKIRPIPKYILEKIRKIDMTQHSAQNGYVRYYAYLTKNDGELVKVTVAVKNKNKRWYYKQCVVHGIHSEKCFVKDMEYSYLAGYMVGWFEEGLSSTPKWYEGKDWAWAYDIHFNLDEHIVNTSYLHKFPEYKYSAWEEAYMGLFKYLRLYEAYPQIEYMTKSGLQQYSDSIQILKKIGQDKNFSKWLMRNRQQLSSKDYYVGVVLKAYKSGRDIDELQKLHKFKLSFAHDNAHKALSILFDKPTMRRIEQYVFKKDVSFATYKDYITACKELDLDLTEERNLLPKDFQRWHEIRIDEYATKKAMLDAEKRKELYAQFAAIAEKYLGLQHNRNDTFIAVIAKSPGELITEGEKLHHCVGRMGYEQKFVREESLIFFIREKANPDVPYVTVEYSPKTKRILQLHGKNNLQPNEETTRYIQQIWLPYANKHLKQIAA